MTAQANVHVQFRRAIERKNLMGAEIALREMGAVDLLAALIALCQGDREALGLLRRRVRKLRPTALPSV